MHILEQIFKNSRLLVFIIVIVSFIASILLYIASINAGLHFIVGFVRELPDTPSKVQYQAVLLLKILDVLLIALTFQIISIAHYHFFISGKTNNDSQFLKALHINSFHDLKIIILQVASLILTIMFLEQVAAVGATLETLYFAVSIAVVMAAVVLTMKSLRH
ncbi:YqhA family protein [Neisseria sp. CCUG12390]|uniref:YqhA family protein n=1 Tax=Neisseria sp. CCUG12390 TaxID=3392035 RepID=UPI003A102A90